MPGPVPAFLAAGSAALTALGILLYAGLVALALWWAVRLAAPPRPEEPGTKRGR